MSGQIIGPIGVLPAAGGTFGLDPNANAVVNGNLGSTTSIVLPGLSTNNANCINIVAASAGGAISGVSDGSGAYAQCGGGGGNQFVLFYKVISGIQSSNVITVASGVGSTSMQACAAAFYGITALDPNGSNPNLGGTTFTTTNANDVLISLSEPNSTASAINGFTLLYGINFLGFSYKVVTATQAGSPFGLSDLTFGSSTTSFSV